MNIELLFGGLAIGGGLAVGAVAIIITVPWSYKEKLAKLEAASKERLALIEKGVDPEKFLSTKKPIGHDPYFWGLLLAGIGLGSLLGVFLSNFKGWNEAVVSQALAVLFGGISLLIYAKRTQDKEKKPE